MCNIECFLVYSLVADVKCSNDVYKSESEVQVLNQNLDLCYLFVTVYSSAHVFFHIFKIGFSSGGGIISIHRMGKDGLFYYSYMRSDDYNKVYRV